MSEFLRKREVLDYLLSRVGQKDTLIHNRSEENRSLKKGQINPLDRGITSIEHSRGALSELYLAIARIEEGRFDYTGEGD